MVNNNVINEYRKLRSLVLSRVRYYKNKGFEVVVEIPKIPKKITQASIRRLSKYTPLYIKERSYAPHPVTGEVINARQYTNIQRNLPKEQHTKPFQPIPDIKSSKSGVNVSRETFNEESILETGYEDIIISSFQNMVNMYPSNTRRIAQDWLNAAIDKQGKSVVAEVLEDARQSGDLLEPENAYKEDEVLEYVDKLTSFLDISAAEKNEIWKEAFEGMDFFSDAY